MHLTYCNEDKNFILEKLFLRNSQAQNSGIYNFMMNFDLKEKHGVNND
jgi:hypothetical protein